MFLRWSTNALSCHAILCVFLSCSRAADEPAPSPPAQHTDVSVAADPPSTPVDEAPKPATVTTPPAQDFATFWRSFRQSLLQSDMKALASMTQFPLIVRGSLDGDPERKISTKAFPKFIPKLLQGEAGLSTTPESLREYVKRVEVPPGNSVDPGGTSAHVADFEFDRVGDRWLFTRTYMDE